MKRATVWAASAAVCCLCASCDPTTAPIGGVTDAVDTHAPDTAATDDAIAVDTAPADPCQGAPCAAAEAPRCATHREAHLTFPAPTCTAVAGEAICSYPDAVVEDCGADGACLLNACHTLGTACDLPYTTHVSRLTLMVPGGQSDDWDEETGQRVDACCFDLDGDGAIDNGIGTTFKLLEPFVGPVADIQAAAILRGPPILDFLGLNLDDLQNDPEVDVIYYTAVGPGEGGAYAINQRGFEPGSPIPLGAFAGRVEGGVFRAEGGYLRLQVGTPFHEMSVEVEQARLEIAIAAPPDGGEGLVTGGAPEFPAGRFGGWVSQTAVFEAFNNYARDFCECTQPVIVGGVCDDNEERICTTGTDSFCGILTDVGACSFLATAFAPDIDTDGDGTDDHISVGYWFAGVPTRIEGVRACE